MTINPFAKTTSIPGHGKIIVNLLGPSRPVLQDVAYQYPLKLIAPDPITIVHLEDGREPEYVHTVFLLTYGGGIVAGDTINLQVSLASTTKLVLLTQGSTKIFKSPNSQVISRQVMSVDISEGAALCYLPDPVQPFEKSTFEQRQTYNLLALDSGLCVCDWVSEGRTARAEKWSFSAYMSRNEFWSAPKDGKRRLLLRDSVLLDNAMIASENVLSRMDGLGVFGTLILYGSLFNSVARYFMEEFRLMPRIGNRQWDPRPDTDQETFLERARALRLECEREDGVLWSAASTRGFVVVKFGAREVQGARRWLRTMLATEGTIKQEFGEGSLLCLR